ncbi:hypothetical protein LPB90_07960, partial [Chryseobacterium sp. LC2016-29]|uniref:hypothetical protein n=1 Tax=Chryseobacterium sp. LC2016-29 TaxID=2897331 RepID=UPI001E43725D
MRNDLLLNEDKNDKIIKRYILSNDKINLQFLQNVKSINIFVGANNSGKSWFMRHLMSVKDYYFSEWKIIVNLVNQFNAILEKDINVYQSKSIMSYNHHAPHIIIRKVEYLSFGSIKRDFNENYLHFENLSKFDRNNWYLFNEQLDENKIDKLISLNLEIKKILDNVEIIEDLKRYYIPTLRTAHSLYDNNGSKFEEDLFLNTLTKNYQIENVTIFTGLHLYKGILNSRNSRKEVRKRFDDFETFVQNNFFSGKKIDIVAYFDK